MTPETTILLAAFAFFLVIAWAARTSVRREEAEERELEERYAEMRREAPLLNRERR